MFLMTVQTFYFFPGMSAPSEGWNVLCFLFLCFIYLAWKVKTRGQFMGFEFYVLILMFIIPIWAGVMSMAIFGQPLFYGILAQRTMILGAGGLALLMFYRVGWIKTEDCKQAFLIPAWTTLVLYSLYAIFLVSTATSGPSPRFVYGFVEIGFFYYGLIGFNRKSKIHYALALPFLLYIISTGQRALLLTTLGTYGLFVLVRGSFARLIVFVPASLCGMAALLGGLYLLNPQYMTDLAVRIDEALTVITTGHAVADVSATIRLEETAVALPYIKNSLLVGNGDISKRWNGGYPGVIHGYFYPSDIGLIGVVYLYGVLGVALFAMQFWWARKYATGASQGVKTSPMTDAIMAFLISYIVLSLEAGTFVNQFEMGVLSIIYLYMVGEDRKARSNGNNIPLRSGRHHPSSALRGLQRPL